MSIQRASHLYYLITVATMRPTMITASPEARQYLVASALLLYGTNLRAFATRAAARGAIASERPASTRTRPMTTDVRVSPLLETCLDGRGRTGTDRGS